MRGLLSLEAGNIDVIGPALRIRKPVFRRMARCQAAGSTIAGPLRSINNAESSIVGNVVKESAHAVFVLKTLGH